VKNFVVFLRTGLFLFLSCDGDGGGGGDDDDDDDDSSLTLPQNLDDVQAAIRQLIGVVAGGGDMVR
jgi:hypothetical protein